jgi:transposase-like protein
LAYSPEQKANAVAAFLGGDSWEKVCREFGIGKATLKRWLDETEIKRNRTEIRNCSGEARESRFNEALEGFLEATVNMLHSWAKECSDPKFIRENPSGVHELGQTVFKSAERIMSSIRDEEEPEAEED